MLTARERCAAIEGEVTESFKEVIKSSSDLDIFELVRIASLSIRDPG